MSSAAIARASADISARLDRLPASRALWMLVHTLEPVEEIAARLGYADTSNFSRVVRRWFGATPREVREGGTAATSRS